MKIKIFLTVAALLLGYYALVFPEFVGIFLALYIIYFIWKIWDYEKDTKEIQKQLEEIKALLKKESEENESIENE